MEFVLFMVLMGYLILRLGSEKAGRYTVRRENANRNERIERFREKIADRELEDELRLFISRPENHDARMEEVKDVYDKILEGKRIDELYPRWLWCKQEAKWSDEYHEKYQEYLCRWNRGRTLMIMMAKRGKFPSYDALCLAQGDYHCNTKLDVEVYRWCMEELARHGVTEPFHVDMQSQRVGYEI